MKIIKRNGAEVPFDITKIITAVTKASDSVGGQSRLTREQITQIAAAVTDQCQALNRAVSVEEVQDLVENQLMDIQAHDVARHYITYRYVQSLKRQTNTTDERILSLIECQNEEVKQENANKNPTVNSVQRDYMAGEISKDLTARLLLDPEIVKAHQEGLIHFHDSDYFAQHMHNCDLVNLEDMLQNGTVISGTYIEKPHSFSTACNIATQIIAQVASNQYGGQSVDVSHLGKYLRRSYNKFKRRITDECQGENVSEELIEKLTRERLQEELKSGVQTIQYQINTLMTTNGQSPFVTLFLYLKEGDPYIKENAMIVEEILRQRLEGIKNASGVYVTPAFPKLVYVLDENNCLRGGEYDYITRLAVKCSAKRMYPDYISAKKMRENYEGNVFAPMGCRSFLAPWKDENGEYKFEGRFNQGVVSINLPQIGILCKGDEEKFWSMLDERLELCFEALMCRHNALKGVLSDVSPVHWQYGAIARLKKGETIDRFLYGGYSSISLGYIGLYELTMLMKGVSQTDPVGEEFAVRVMKHLRETCDRWKAETNIGFALYGTPAESLCYRFARIDKERFGTIPNVTDKGYYTNSYHVDVREEIDAFSKFDFESQFQAISSGGAISYVEIPKSIAEKIIAERGRKDD
mgnify:CR=1 FL=1